MKYIVTKEDLAKHMREHSTLVEYVRDNLGFKCGVVVATGAGKLGWSKVSTYDVVDREPTLRGIPAWADFEDEFIKDVDMSTYLFEKFAKMAIAVQERNAITTIEVPAFNRFKALQKAINMSISNPDVLSAPYAMENACDDMYVRSMVYFKK